MNSMVQATSCESHTHLELSEVDINKVDELVSRISDTDPNTVVEFGRDVTTLTEGCSDEMLAHATPEDLEHMGKKLTEVVVIAKTLNCQGFDSKSTVPVIGSLINRFRLTKEKYVAQFMTTKEQMEAIVEEVVETNGKLSQRNVELEKMYNAVRAEYHLLELHIVAGKKKLGQLHQSISERSNLVSNGDETQLLNDMHNQANFLEKRVQDLLALQQLALLTLPSIRLIQSNNSMLCDKFHNIRELTLPSWKRQFTIALVLDEQERKVDLANLIDDTNNELLIRNAELLKKNAIKTAKANQRLVIDLKTLEKVQESIVTTFTEVINIQKAGMEECKRFESQVHQMRQALSQTLARKESAAQLN